MFCAVGPRTPIWLPDPWSSSSCTWFFTCAASGYIRVHILELIIEISPRCVYQNSVWMIPWQRCCLCDDWDPPELPDLILLLPHRRWQLVNEHSQLCRSFPHPRHRCVSYPLACHAPGWTKLLRHQTCPGADDCFVFMDTWHHSKLIVKNDQDELTSLRIRMLWTFKVWAGGAGICLLAKYDVGVCACGRPRGVNVCTWG